MEDNNIIKKYLEEKKYYECSNILKEKIINYIINLIKEKYEDYEYTNIIELIEMSEIFIDDERKNIARNLEYFSFEEKDIDVLERMLEICKIYNIK